MVSSEEELLQYAATEMYIDGDKGEGKEEFKVRKELEKHDRVA